MRELYFSIHKDLLMTVYLIKKENELQIHQVQPKQEVRFLALHGDKMLMTGETAIEVPTKDVGPKFGRYPGY